MNLVEGRIVGPAEADEILTTLRGRVLETMKTSILDPGIVISACDKVLQNLDEEKYLKIIQEIGIDIQIGKTYLEMARVMFSGTYLKERLRKELDMDLFEDRRFKPPFSNEDVVERLVPLGVLLHIAAGNADGLPAFSVLEGLLSGNINILKLPEVDGGISVLLLQELILAEPALAEYIYVFDYSSKDTGSISKLIEVSDGVVIWGGDAAVSALRGLIPPNVKLIEWGHKVSFAFVTKEGASVGNLTRLARQICRTNQLLCSSCQGIYLDADGEEDIDQFCRLFLPILEEESAAAPADFGIGTQAQITLRLQTEMLLASDKRHTVYRGKGCSLIASGDSHLEPSLQFRNCWVKPLLRKDVLAVLRPHKNHLQTAGLLCGAKEREELMDLFMRCGVCRIADGMKMSASYCGAAHDGEYPLRRYTRLMSVEY